MKSWGGSFRSLTCFIWQSMMKHHDVTLIPSCHLQAAAWKQSNSSSPVSSLATGSDGSAVTDDLRNFTQRPPAPPETFRVAHRNSFLDFPTLPAFCLIEKYLKSALTVRINKTNKRYITGIWSLLSWIDDFGSRGWNPALHRKAEFFCNLLHIPSPVSTIQWPRLLKICF